MKRTEIKTQLDFYVDVAILYLKCLPDDISLENAKKKDMVRYTLNTPDDVASENLKRLKGIPDVEHCIDQGLLWLIR